MKSIIASITVLTALVAAVVGVAPLGLTPEAHAASFTVDSTADAVDAAPGDGVCDDGAGNCTLRAAIQETNALAGADTIAVPAGTYVATIAGAGEDAAATGDLDITDELTLNGAGPAATIIDGGALDRVLHVDPASAGVAVVITGVTITNGNVDQEGAGVLVGGFVATAAPVTIISSNVSGNVVAGNTADGGGLYARGGTLTISASTFSNNQANNGGGMVNENGAVTLDGSTVSGNTVAGEGGGIWNYGGTFALTTSAVSGNVAGFQGGGGISNNDTMTITNSTISGNTAGRAGGVYNSGALSVKNATISDNTGDPGGIQNENGTVELKNSIVAINQGGADCQGAFVTTGNNLDSDNSCGLVAAGDLPSTDPQLGPLADNGGPTQTHALLAGSPAIDAADDMACPTIDQRDVGRPLDGDGDSVAVCDIGAYEAAFVPPPPTATNTPPATSTATPQGQPTPTATIDSPGLPNAGSGDGQSGGSAAGWMIALLAVAGAVTAAAYRAVSVRR